MYEPEMETMPPGELRKLQERRLKENVEYCYENVPFYRKKFKDSGVTPRDIEGIEDLQKIPFTAKDDLRDHYPYGLLAVPLEKVVRFHSSSGTTGTPTVVGYTGKDIETWSRIMARGIATAGARGKDIVQVAYGYGLFTGGLGLHYGSEALGAATIPAGGGITPTQRQIQILRDMKSTVICCTPSYALYLAEEARKAGIDPGRDFSLKVGIFGAEPWSDNMRKKVEEALSLRAHDVYGLSEIWGPGVGMECEERKGFHIWGDHFIVEVIDPRNGEVLGPGEKGELVFTTLTREAMPMLRYRSGDISIMDEEPCECGRTHPRMLSVMGRSDDMLIVRGINVFPSQVEHVLMRIPGIAEHYQIIIDREILDNLQVKVEVTPEVFSDRLSELVDLQKKVEGELSAVLNVKANVELVEPGTIPRSAGKAQRIVDKRKED